MIYLLDVNVLLAVAYRVHDLHERADRWPAGGLVRTRRRLPLSPDLR